MLVCAEGSCHGLRAGIRCAPGCCALRESLVFRMISQGAAHLLFFLEGRAVFALSFLSPVAVSAAVYYYVRSSAFCFVKASCKKILVLLNVFFADRTGSFYSGLAAGKAVRASVDIANLVVDLPVCCKNF